MGKLIVIIGVLFLTEMTMAQAVGIQKPSVFLFQPQVTTVIPLEDPVNIPLIDIDQQNSDQAAEQQDEVEGPSVPTPEVLPILNPSDIKGTIEFAILKHPHFAGVALVAQGSTVLYTGHFGYIPHSTTPYSIDMPFLLASVTKQFTAALVLKEVDKGTIKLDDPVRKFLTEATPLWDENDHIVGKGRRAKLEHFNSLTIADLLTHTSGLPDYINLRFTSQEKILSYLEKLKPRWNPGSRFDYSNSNYFLLGTIVERVTGRYLSDLIKTEITDPLGMTRSKMIPPWVPGAAQLYSSDNEPLAAHPVNYFAVGDMVSTLDDLFKWEKALIDDGAVLSPQALAQMLSVQPHTEHFYRASTVGVENAAYRKGGSHIQKVPDYYGFGERISKVNNKEIVWHTGHLNNHTTLVEHYMEDDITIIILTNSSNYNVIGMGNDIIDAIFHIPTVPAPVGGRLLRVHNHKRRHHTNRSVASIHSGG